ncbi:retrovirus-related Pol polyprotein from transposon 297 [Trichonephila clavipes]|uniref:Retrovirus-related Pol polyprotein from transposon 297 n=1 Tax=Trichonephila clavipes TaxID=2585209 RepID=A0A8X7BA10_TRICX|nr:retrovirus-related Pol polyprotein from transposon 297 [Trichonephila clavipes]
MALGGSLPQINLGVQGVTHGGHHSVAQQVNPEFTGYLRGRALDWFEVLGYRVVEDKATDYAHLKQALSEQFPVVRNRSELETRFYSSSQKHNQKSSDFVYDLLKIHKTLKLEMTEEKLIDHIISRKIRGSSWESRDIKPNENNRFPNRNRQENWRETRDSPEAYRFAIDYRKLNAITKYPRYHLPVNDDLITNIPHTGVMSTLDLKSGYFQLAISPKDIAKTAFITRNGTFAFLRMPFGLSGAAPNFQKAIDTILKPVIGRFVSVYMDDVIVTSPSFNEHLDHLNQVITDHAALTKLTNGKNLSSRMIRWALAIRVQHRMGTSTGVQNVVADVLSRNLVGNLDGSQISCAALRALALNSREQLIREQRGRS